MSKVDRLMTRDRQIAETGEFIVNPRSTIASVNYHGPLSALCYHSFHVPLRIGG